MGNCIKIYYWKINTGPFGHKKIPEYCETMGFTLIPLEPVDALNSLYLPQKNTHKDPFDRMLISVHKEQLCIGEQRHKN
jgi:PIN domain nuclease of toxin-antitoxin system